MKKQRKKRIFLLAIAMLMTFLSVACAPKSTDKPLQSPAPTAQQTRSPFKNDNDDGTHTIVDNTGNRVAVPNDIERIAIISTIPLASVYVMVAGGGEKLVGLTPDSKNAAVTSLLYRVAPELENVSTAFANGETVNVEEVAALEPDVVFYNTQAAGDVAAAEELAALGIPGVGFSTSIASGNTIETINAWVELLGDVMGNELQADAIINYGRDIEAMVKERVSTIPESERKSALILGNYTQNAILAAGKMFGRYWLLTIGANNVALELEQALSPVNLEQIYAWDPDVIYLNSFSAFTADDILNSTAVEGHDWSGLTAVKNSRVYKMPLGMYYWFPPCSDTPLALQWMAQKLYPELFSDIDMDKEIKEYYKNFYGITLTDEDLKVIYSPPAESAMG